MRVWEKEIEADEETRLIIQVTLWTEPLANFSKKGLLFHKDRLVLPEKFSRHPTILSKFHYHPNGHSGFDRTYKRISILFY